MDDASERAIEEDMLDQFNYFDDEDEELIDRREPAPLDSFDLVDEEADEVEGESVEPPQPSRLDSLLSRAPMHHGVRAGALHMKTDWHQIVTAGDELAVDVQLAARDLLETCDHAQGGGLAAAGRADENDEFLIGDVEVELLHGNDALVGDLKVDLLLLGRLFALLLFLALLFFATDERVDLLDVYEFYFCHTVLDSDCAASAPHSHDRRAWRTHCDMSPQCRTGSLPDKISSFIFAAAHHKCGLVHLD